MDGVVPETYVKDEGKAREMAEIEEKQRQIAKEALELAFDACLSDNAVNGGGSRVKLVGELTDPQMAKNLLNKAVPLLREVVGFRGFEGFERWRGGEDKTELEKKFEVSGQKWVCSLYPFTQQKESVGQNIKLFREGGSMSNAEYGFYVVFKPGVDVWDEYNKGILHKTEIVVETYSGGRKDPRSFGNDVTIKINREVKPRDIKLGSNK